MQDEDPEFAGYLARHYARLGDHERHRAGRQRQLLRTYRHLLPTDRDVDLLEIGPGYGQWLELLRRDLGYRRATAVDVSREVVAFCNDRMPGSATWVPDTLAYLRQNPERFERVFALHVLEHMPVPAARDLVRGIGGALRPGGRCVVEVPNLANLFTGAYLRHADLTHQAGYTEQSLRQLLESAGLEQIECFEERPAPGGLKGALTATFRAAARVAQRLVYRGYELPVPVVLTPALCATAVRGGTAP